MRIELFDKYIETSVNHPNVFCCCGDTRSGRRMNLLSLLALLD